MTKTEDFDSKVEAARWGQTKTHMGVGAGKRAVCRKQLQGQGVGVGSSGREERRGVPRGKTSGLPEFELLISGLFTLKRLKKLFQKERDGSFQSPKVRPPVFLRWGCYNRTPHKPGAYEQQKRITHGSGGWRL